ncbi:Re/Si-specific NAD(P)(+) transhydrogenase subunit alpha [Desulfocurvus sp.]|uniref:Re/Si-specific NAD(P)(+) transhydrogenase subunit alpha n=1 Tax=Desulfocurvus sp. TaxID=2871698 RepID=UPI0025BBE8BC|nr:Re/Si-specific NAD(P)(+) transhydrogenase subunit alpha [Desulfocurvus sp.]MCK9239466.1 Re/Si-specific NAD(P)(+) transhydrogenase subunit alpha [Desulfocurvus sp.]
MILAVPKETFPGERRVALVPGVLPQLLKAGFEVVVQAGAGLGAGIADADYQARGARVEPDRAALIAGADVLLMVRTPGANPGPGRDDIALLRSGQVLIGLADPTADPAVAQAVAATGAALFALELIPRISRAQGMDVLSSMATLAGYKAVLLAADHLPKMFPMLMTAAGTVAPARVFVVGVGVAGLMAIAQARRLGAVVEAYDVRPAVREQVQSLGAKFVEMELDAGDAEDQGGYAKALGEEFYRRQRELMARVVAASDVVITTAAVPGRKAPVLVTAEMVRAMQPGSVVVDLAAATGGNCELTRPDETVTDHGVTILGPTNAPSDLAVDGSRMYAKNVTAMLLNMSQGGVVDIHKDDEIVAGTCVARDGKVVHPLVLERLDRGGA